jgi:HSP20 family molecular chaperone IbpA
MMDGLSHLGFHLFTIRRRCMTAANSPQQDSTAVRIGSKLGEAFERVEERIRERAYQLFQDREEHHGDPEKDWFEAQWQLVAPVELEVKEQKKNIVVEGSLKGFAAKEIEIEVGDGELKVFGSHTESRITKKDSSTESSSGTMHFYQAVPLPCAVDGDASEAKIFKNGKLKITLPKRNAA